MRIPIGVRVDTMTSKPTKPTTKPIRIPIKFEQQVRDYIARLKAGKVDDLEPLPDRAIAELTMYATADVAIGNAGIQVLRRYLLKDWLDLTVQQFGFLGARERIKSRYGEKFVDLVLPIPPIEGEWWEILGVSPVASVVEVRRVHRELVAQWHPDRNAMPEAKAIMQAINRAWAEYKKQGHLRKRAVNSEPR